jgi:hypothetical protein
MEKREHVKNVDIELPISWSPSKRFELTLGMGTGLRWRARMSSSRAESEELDQYAEWVSKNYLIEPDVQSATVQHIVESNYKKAFSDRCNNDYYKMIKYFETECLGIDPNIGKAYYYISPAGYDGANYPTNLIANQLGLNVEEFMQYTNTNYTEPSFIVIKSNKYLIPVYTERITQETTFVSGVMELNTEGEELLEMMLWAYERGLKGKD